MKRTLAILLLLTACSVIPVAANPELDADFAQSTIVISSSHAACYRFDVYLALESKQWQRGLMHVRTLEPWSGMLFVYRAEARRSMWMKNTFLPLDMLFIRADGTISSIVENTEPQSLRSISSTDNVRYVLELNAGVTARLQIAAGDTLVWAGDVNPPSQD
ncbi:MAG: DUF192 domain-containing protein [Woeseia sp.]|nr:DUF192 domain-containing protein [Woeseia sp.]MBT8097864.1 DUF192 domain-containing protein [Woeseia sp.]NNE60280.1 DUF192 domain-containing protein [Woeseia sp.]NNL54304.1 DUF192 domain-containing protein [Woeseia sp.]